MSDLSYPIGKFAAPETITAEHRAQYIAQIAQAPAKLRNAVAGLSQEQLNTPYRPEGWTICQVVHHLADSHMVSLMRIKTALTEDNPTVKSYDENLWAKLADGAAPAIDDSLNLIEALHHRWVVLLNSLSEADFARTFNHSENGVTRLDKSLGIYAWHSDHHIAHITGLRIRQGW